MHFVMPCNDESHVAVDKFVTYVEGLITTITIFLEVRGVTS